MSFPWIVFSPCTSDTHLSVIVRGYKSGLCWKQAFVWISTFRLDRDRKLLRLIWAGIWWAAVLVLSRRHVFNRCVFPLDVCVQGVLESFVGTALTGAVFCLFAGQPLTILSSTGPVLVFERLLFNFSKWVTYTRRLKKTKTHIHTETKED